MNLKCTVNGISSLTSHGFSVRDIDQDDAVMTTDHAASSYGQPVVIFQGQAYGPGDYGLGQMAIALWGDATAEDVATCRAAGWTRAYLWTAEEQSVG